MPAPNLVLSIVEGYLSHEIPEAAYVNPDMATGHTMGFRNYAPTWIRVANDDDTNLIITIKAVRPCSQGELHDKVDVISTGEAREYGPFDRHHYNDLDGYVHFTLTPEFGVDPLNVGVVAVRLI